MHEREPREQEIAPLSTEEVRGLKAGDSVGILFRPRSKSRKTLMSRMVYLRYDTFTLDSKGRQHHHLVWEDGKRTIWRQRIFHGQR